MTNNRRRLLLLALLIVALMSIQSSVCSPVDHPQDEASVGQPVAAVDTPASTSVSTDPIHSEVDSPPPPSGDDPIPAECDEQPPTDTAAEEVHPHHSDEGTDTPQSGTTEEGEDDEDVVVTTYDEGDYYESPEGEEENEDAAVREDGDDSHYGGSEEPQMAKNNLELEHAAQRWHPHLLPYIQGADTPAHPADLSAMYYAAMEALAEGKFVLFKERVQAGAAAGHSRLHWLLGVLHAHGLGVLRDNAKAVLHYTLAAVQSVPEAHMALGHRYLKGNGVPSDCRTAMAHFREAADSVAMTYDGSANPAMRTGRFDVGHDSTQMHRQQVRQDLKAESMLLDSLIYRADTGSLDALLSLGFHYKKGTGGVKRNWLRAQQYFQRAAERGAPGAFGALGQLYTTGDLTADPPFPRDFEKAEQFFRKGAALEDGTSLNGLGYLHAIGYLSEDKLVVQSAAFSAPDFSTAAMYFAKARKAGSVEASYNLGVLLLHGRGAPLDARESRNLFSEASQKGSVLALWQLGLMHESSGDCERACSFYEMVCSYGSWYDRSSPSGFALTADWEDDDNAADDDGEEAAGSQPSAGSLTNDEQLSSMQSSHRRLARTQQQARRLAARRVQLHIQDVSSIVTESPLLNFIDALVLAETGSNDAGRRAATLLEDMEVPHASLSEKDLVKKGLAEAGNPIFAKSNKDLLELMDESNDEMGDHTIFLDWQIPTRVRVDGDGQAHKVQWRLTQREAKSMLLVALLKRTERTRDSRLRLGDFYFYGESALTGVDMSQARVYYELAGKLLNSQALFNLGVMYQLGLDPAATEVQDTESTTTATTPPSVKYDYGNNNDVWTPGLDVSAYPTRAPPRTASQILFSSFFSILRNEPHATRGVDLHIAKRFYDQAAETSQNAGVRLAVQCALVSLNLQWWWTHFSQVPGGLSSQLHLSMPFYHAESVAGQQTEEAVYEREAVDEKEAAFTEATSWSEAVSKVGAMAKTMYFVVESFILLLTSVVLIVALLLRHHIA